MKKNDKKGDINSANNPPPMKIKLYSGDDTSQFAENIINTVREPLIVLDQDLKVVTASRSFYKFFKVNSDETIGRLIYELGNNQWNIPKLRKLLETILPEKTTFDNYEVEHVFSTIGKRIMLLNARQIKRAFGKEKIILLAIEDITERRIKEKTLSEKNRLTSEYLDILLDHAHAPIIIWDSSFAIKRFNYEFEKLSGYVSAEVIDKKIDILFPRGKIDLTIELIKNNINDDKSEIIEIDILTKNKDVKTVLWNSSNIFDKEGNKVVATIAQDITKHKQIEEALTISEARYRRLFETARDGIIILDADTGMIVNVNSYLIELLGYSHDVFLKKNIWNIGIFKDIAANKDKFMELQKDEHIKYSNLPLETAYGKQIKVEFVSNVYLVDNRKVIQCNIRDITDRILMEETIQQLNVDLEQRVIRRTEQLETINKEMESFSYSVSHDLRAPLRGIDGFANILLEDYSDRLDKEGQRFLNLIRENIQKMGHLIDDLLAFSRIGLLGLDKSEIDMHTLANSVYNELTSEKDRETISFTVAHLPFVKGDASMMRQLWSNLISNAIKFSSKEDNPKIEIDSKSEEGKRIYFIHDNGVGFDMKYAGKLFGVFQRLHNEAEFKGTGIGLAIVKSIVTKHEGKIWAESEMNVGTTINFMI